MLTFIDLLKSSSLRLNGEEEENHENSDTMEPEKWADFLKSLYLKLSAYEIQKDKNKYNVADIENWGLDNKPSGIKITENNLEGFLSKISSYNLTNYDVLKNIKLTTNQFTELNNVLKNVLKHEITIQCKKPFIYFKGSLISISDVLKNAHLSEKEKCGNLTMVSEEYKFINIFASNTIFVDQDLEFSGLHQSVSIIAPKWEIIGSRKIDLSGVDGKPLPKIIINKLRKFTLHGYTGDDGKPGLPGGAGGNFFGIGDEFVNGSNLNITTSGGNGSAGEDGEPGGKGGDGKDAVLPNNVYGVQTGGFVTQIPDEVCGQSSVCDIYWRNNGMACKADSVSKYWYKWEREGTYLLYGTVGGTGGDGGDGGKGGTGGFSGDNILLNFKNSSEVLTQSIAGKNGNDGKGGRGGDGGYHGNDLVAHCWFSSGEFNLYSSTWSVRETRGNNRLPTGKNGYDGKHTTGMKKPEEKVKNTDSIITINEYKSYIRENLKTLFNKSSLINFLIKLDSNTEVLKIYNTAGLANDFKYLEMQVHELSKDIDFIPFYRSLLEKIDAYSRHPKPNEGSNDYKKVLGFLYTAALSRVYKLKDDLESNLIVEIDGYLDIVKQNINDLKDLQKAKHKVDIVKRHKESYETSISKKIKQAMDFEDQITHEIESILKQIKSKLYSLVDETVKLQEKAKEEQKELIDLKLKLANACGSRGAFQIFETIGNIVSSLGPAGSVAGAVVKKVSTVTESLVIDDKNTEIKTFELPDAVQNDLKSATRQIKSIINNRALDLSQVLDIMSQDFVGYPDIMGDISVKLSDIKNNLNKFPDLKNVKALEEELKEILKQKEEELHNQVRSKRSTETISKKIDDKKADGALKAIKKSQIALKLMEFGFDIFQKYKDDQAKLDVISTAIDQADKNFQKLKEFEEKIYDITLPMLKNIGDNLNDIANKLGTQSKVSLQVIQWQIHKVLSNLKLEMHKLTKGFENLEDELPHCVEMLDEAMKVLTDIYGSIQNYEEEQNLSNYIADVSSATATSINIRDRDLGNFVLELEILIKSNLVLKQYELAMNAFKQFVFPLAQKYLKNMTLPSQLELEKNIENLVHKAAEEIGSIKSQIVLYRKSIESYDKYIRTGEFKSNYISTSPFYVWENKHYKEMISNLLSGKEIVMKADVRESQLHKDAIKFKYIYLNFSSKNSTLQSRINETLKAFSVRATHLGSSYYRYEDKMYLIQSESQTIEFNLEKNSFDEPVDVNEVYIKIMNGDFLLSPYSVWKFKLFNLKDVFTFKDLSKFKDDVDLQLVGVGKYINSMFIDVDLDVDKYYKVIDDYIESGNNQVKSDDGKFGKEIASDNETNNQVDQLESENNASVHVNGLNRSTLPAYNYSLNIYRKKRQVNYDEDYDNNLSWLSWLQLPNIQIFPGAEAVVIEEKSEKYLKFLNVIEDLKKFGSIAQKKELANKMQKEKENVLEHENTRSEPKKMILKLIDDISVSVQNGINMFDEVFFSKKSNKLFSDQSEDVIKHPPYSHKTETFENAFAIAADDFNTSANFRIHANDIDLYGNLLVGQIFAHKMFGTNSLSYGCDYLSPSQEQCKLIEKLANKIIPITQKCENEDSCLSYDNQPQWLMDTSRDYTNEPDELIDQMPEDLFSHCISMFNEAKP